MSFVQGASFNVRFNLTGAPTLVLTDTTILPPSGLVGAFSITQPDGYTRVGNINTPDINTPGGSFSIPLRLDSKGEVQCGTYNIAYTVIASGFEETLFTRNFQMAYNQPQISIAEEFDVFTPNLSLRDDTVYQVSNFNNGPVTRSWSVVSTPTGTITGTQQVLSLQFGGQYYDANYSISLSGSTIYTHQVYSWLTVQETVSKSVNTYAQTPPDVDEIVESIHQLKVKWDEAVNKCLEQEKVRADFELAQVLFNHIIDRIVNSNTAGIYEDLKDLVRILANNQIPAYTPTNQPIQPYDLSLFTSGAVWGSISGDILSQTDLVAYISAQISGRKYVADIGNGVAVTYVVTHSFNSVDVTVEVFENATGDTVLVDVDRSGVNTVTVSFEDAPSLNQYRVIVRI